MQIKWKFEWKWTANVHIARESAHVWWVWVERQSETAKREIVTYKRDDNSLGVAFAFSCAAYSEERNSRIAFLFERNFSTIFSRFSRLCHFFQHSFHAYRHLLENLRATNRELSTLRHENHFISKNFTYRFTRTSITCTWYNDLIKATDKSWKFHVSWKGRAAFL